MSKSFIFDPKMKFEQKLYEQFTLKRSKYLTNFQLGLQVSWTIMGIYVKKITTFYIWNYFKHLFFSYINNFEISWLYMWETSHGWNIQRCGWTIVIIFKVMAKIKQYFSFMHINKTHVILRFKVSNEFGKFILTLCLSLICCVLCMNCGHHRAHARCKFDFYFFFLFRCITMLNN